LLQGCLRAENIFRNLAQKGCFEVTARVTMAVLHGYKLPERSSEDGKKDRAEMFSSDFLLSFRNFFVQAGCKALQA